MVFKNKEGLAGSCDDKTSDCTKCFKTPFIVSSTVCILRNSKCESGSTRSWFFLCSILALFFFFFFLTSLTLSKIVVHISDKEKVIFINPTVAKFADLILNLKFADVSNGIKN